ncbi:MAG TPA: SDR family oxidoreductase [Anaerolineales bacterium]|nr:SDR family oxidoreductase [Anaerolineales bacterium]
MEEQSTSNLKNLNVVVTGAARGLGAALALTLSDLGCNVVLCGRSLTALDIIAGYIESRAGRRPQRFALDLADTASVESAAKEIIQSFPTIDVLINNGAAWLGERATPYEAAEVMATINSALTGTFLFTQALIPTLQKSTRPDVVIIGSVSGLLNMSLQGVSVPFYTAKHGQTALADGLRQMFLGTQIRSLCIHPPWIEDMSPLDEEWNTVSLRTKNERVTNRDIVEAVIFAITRPRHVTIASMIIDSDAQGMDYRSHLRS